MFRLRIAQLLEKRIKFGDYLKRIGNVEDVGFATRPAAVRVEVDGAAFVDKTPSHNMRLFSVAARRESLRMTRRRSRLTDLVKVAHEGENCLVLSRLVDQRFAATKRRAGVSQEIRNRAFG